MIIFTCGCTTKSGALSESIREKEVASEALRYDAEAGYVVLKLANGEELWVSANWEGYHAFLAARL